MKYHHYPNGVSDGAGGLATFRVIHQTGNPAGYNYATGVILHAVGHPAQGHTLAIVDIPPGNTYS
jgi:hypothetical protein